jgi:uncharacterized protein (UPF0212 family)
MTSKKNVGLLAIVALLLAFTVFGVSGCDKVVRICKAMMGKVTENPTPTPTPPPS